MPSADTRTYVRDALSDSTWRWKAMDVAMKVAMPVLLGISAWTMTNLMDLDKRVGVLEATTVTRRAADKERAQVTQLLLEVKVILARIEESDKQTARRLDQIERRLGDR